MLDIGFFELLVIAIIGLLVVGPEKLPKYIAQGVKMLRNVKDMASKAKDDIVESAGIKDLDLKNLSNLDPSKLANNVFDVEVVLDGDGAEKGVGVNEVLFVAFVNNEFVALAVVVALLVENKLLVVGLALNRFDIVEVLLVVEGGGGTLYFFSRFLISSCSLPLYFSNKVGISLILAGLY